MVCSRAIQIDLHSAAELTVELLATQIGLRLAADLTAGLFVTRKDLRPVVEMAARQTGPHPVSAGCSYFVVQRIRHLDL